MIIIPANSTISAVSMLPPIPTQVNLIMFLMEVNTSTGTETYIKDQQRLENIITTLYTATANGPTFVKSIHVVNTDTNNILNFRLFVGGTAAVNAITPVLNLPAGGCAIYEDNRGWTFYYSTGLSLKKSAFSRIEVQRFINPGAGTYTPTVGMKSCIVIATGGGGGAGGSDTASGGSGDVGVGAGGGAGGTTIGFFTAAIIGASKSFSIGSAGTGGVSTGGTGGIGGNTTWDTNTLIGTGGNPGAGSGSTTQDALAVEGGLGGVPSGGTINIPGGSGSSGITGSFDGTIDLVFALGGMGGGSFWSGGGRPSAAAQSSLTTDSVTSGAVGFAYGAGGGGGHDLTSASGSSGGAGMSGIIMVIEFIGC